MDINIYYLDIIKVKYNQIRYIILLLIILIIIEPFFRLDKVIYQNLLRKKDSDIKVCLCTLGKNENKYAKEFIEYYQKLEVDKIFLYDNNDILGENFNDVINEYIESGFVEVLNWRGKEKIIMNIMNDCYKKNNKKYDWLIFYEFDEFIFLKNFTNIKSFLNDIRFYKCKKILLNWIFHTDNNLLYYDNRPVVERFPEREIKARNKSTGGLSTVKSIIKGRIKKLKFNCIHRLSTKIKGCDGFGKFVELIGIETNNSDYENYYIDHYYCKSTEEFIDKINKGCALFSQDKNYKLARIKTYFGYNKITLQKINLIENKTGFDLLEYKKLIENFNI